MDVSRQASAAVPERGPRARTRRLMLVAATRLMQDGTIPSITAVAEEADVSRATAYRYFPTQAALVHAVVDEALGPILDWHSESGDALERTQSLLSTSIPRIEDYEATFRAALKHSLEQWAMRNAGVEMTEPAFTRGHRVSLLRDAVSPLTGRISDSSRERLAQALSLLFGIEALVILKDIWGIDGGEAKDVILWAAELLVTAASASEV
ncbi:MAG: TetR/AcrR family transcriptional regulator [Rhizobiaceae bacterium]